jgi:hypothetical protein
MKKFIAEHVELIESISELKKMDIEKKKSRKRFKQIVKKLRTHLKKEDKKIIGGMIQKIRVSRDSAKEINRLLEKVSGVTVFTDYIYDKYRQKNVSVGFGVDMRHLQIILKKRIQIEEKLLFPDHKKTNSKSLLKKIQKWLKP